MIKIYDMETLEEREILFRGGSGADVSAPVAEIRRAFPKVPIIATGGPTEESILRTIQAGANAITYTPPSNGVLFARIMNQHRKAL